MNLRPCLLYTSRVKHATASGQLFLFPKQSHKSLLLTNELVSSWKAPITTDSTHFSWQLLCIIATSSLIFGVDRAKRVSNCKIRGNSRVSLGRTRRYTKKSLITTENSGTEICYIKNEIAVVINFCVRLIMNDGWELYSTLALI